MIFDTAKESRLRQFWLTNEPLRVLAQEWGCSDSYVSQYAKRLGLPSRMGKVTAIRSLMLKRRFEGRIGICTYLKEEADRRGISVRALEELIIRAVGNDRLVDAVLDDADQLKKAS